MSSTSSDRDIPWALERVKATVPPRIAHLAAELRECDDDGDGLDDGTLLCARVFESESSSGQAMWVHAARRTEPVEFDDFDNEHDIYRPPMFYVFRVFEDDRQEFGEFAYVCHKDDEQSVRWLVADEAFILIGYPRGMVSLDEFLMMCRTILNDR